jgi:BirA family biotin operon repressor/biotin-[acetyl-CoA-carboxylase] ligase
VTQGAQISSYADRVETFDVLSSTSDLCMARARAGEQGPLWIMAHEQTAGRGRLGRVWSSPRGNLHASCLIVDETPSRIAPQMGFVAGLALIDALRALAPQVVFALKWPNDVLASGAKLAGVLVEGTTLADGRFALVIGFGANCAHHPEGLAYRATDLAALGRPCAPEDALVRLTHSFARRRAQWAQGAGFADLRADWLACAAGLGATIDVRQGERLLRGTFETLDAEGRLILSGPNGRVALEAGDVFLPDATPGNG